MRGVLALGWATRQIEIMDLSALALGDSRVTVPSRGAASWFEPGVQTPGMSQKVDPSRGAAAAGRTRSVAISAFRRHLVRLDRPCTVKTFAGRSHPRVPAL